MVSKERQYTIGDLFDADLWPLTIGFDRIQAQLDNFPESFQRNTSGYPPHNIIKTSEEEYTIELAVAGFSKDQLVVEVKEDMLTVSGNNSTDSELMGDKIAAEEDYIHRGIANRSFTKRFKLAESVKVINGDLQNGMLKIFLKHIIPEEKKARKIEIGTFEDASKKELLMEES